ncbi:MAG: adenine deaminase [Methanobacterium sp.]|uniref:adenine deaminase n=1 Tax=Methanobacterium sp. TaxID=2164 RepID=UPI003C76185C
MVLVKGNLLNVSTEEIYGAEINIQNGIITCVKPVNHEFKGLILPGFIDAHIHIESSMLTPSRFAEAVVPHGTTSIVADPHEIANVLGLDGINYMVKDASTVPLKVFLTAPSCVPATIFETSGAKISTEEIRSLLKEDNVVALGEMMNFPGVICDDPEVMAKIDTAIKIGKPIDGHAPLLSGSELCKYIKSGISTDHECSKANEAIEKRRLGMKLMLREGSSAKNLKDLALIGGDFIVSDDKHPEDLLKGHVDEMLKNAIEYGIEPIQAIKMVTKNPADHYNLNTGDIIPGKAADMILIDSMDDLNVEEVIINGKLTAKNGKPLFDVRPCNIPNTFKINFKKPSDFDVSVEGSIKTVRVIEVFDDQLITNETSSFLDVTDGKLNTNLNGDILKIAVVERYGHGRVSNAFVKGFGLKDGAIASSVSHDSHNIIAVGTNSNDITKAVNTILKNKGGLVAVSKDKIYALELPIAGLMSTKSATDVSNDLKILHLAVENMGSKLRSPFMLLSFMGLLVIPKLKISDMGLFDVEKFNFVDLIKD